MRDSFAQPHFPNFSPHTSRLLLHRRVPTTASSTPGNSSPSLETSGSDSDFVPRLKGQEAKGKGKAAKSPKGKDKEKEGITAEERMKREQEEKNVRR